MAESGAAVPPVVKMKPVAEKIGEPPGNLRAREKALKRRRGE